MSDIDIVTAETQSSQTETKTPFMLYVDSQKSGRNYNELREDYVNLSMDQQYEWIVKAVELAPDSIEECLTKDELRIYRGQLKQTSSAYNLFVKDMFDKIKHKTNSTPGIFTEIGRLWKELDANKKAKYVETAAKVSWLERLFSGIWFLEQKLKKRIRFYSNRWKRKQSKNRRNSMNAMA